MKTNNKAYKPLLLAATLGAACTASHAQSTDAMDDKFRLAGFATIAYGKNLNEDEGNIGGFSADESGEYRDFNKFGLRLDVDLDDKLSFAAQMLADGERDYDPEFDWLYASYSILPNLKVSVGKTTIPLFMYSDYLDTTYAYQWLNAPHAVYGAGNIKSTEGIRVNWKADMGGAWSSDLTVWAGNTDEYQADVDTNLTVDNGLGVAWEVEREWLTLRAVYFQGKTSAVNSPYIDSAINDINTFLTTDFSGDPNNPEGANIGGVLDNADIADLDVYDDMVWEDEDSSFAGFGAKLDFESVFFSAEATRVEIDGLNVAADTLDSWYAMIGTRLPGSVSVSLTYSESNDKTKGDEIGDRLEEDLLAAYPSHPAPELLVGLAQQTGNDISDFQYNKAESLTFSTRWDFHRSASLKFEYYMTDYKDSEDAKEKSPDAFAIGMDLVF